LTIGDGAFFGYAFGDHRQDDGAYWWHALARDKPLSEAERQALSGEYGVAALLAAGDGWFAGMRHFVAATATHIAPLDLFDVAGLSRWHSGRVVLVGDAAHAVSPHSGQGASMALEDAIVLKMLKANRAEPEASFASYARERRWRAERVIEWDAAAAVRNRRDSWADCSKRSSCRCSCAWHLRRAGSTAMSRAGSIERFGRMPAQAAGRGESSKSQARVQPALSKTL
jgi:2-polyprenyl-6-methoxyphenol hydroxylase-like FAD-dependent oxidoreductase